jgi:hypothetical protein
MLPTASARADGPPAAPPGYPPPGAFAPPGYAPWPVPRPDWAAQQEPYTPMKRRSSAMIAGGIVLISLSSVGLIAGAATFAAGTSNALVPQPGCGFCGFVRSPGDSGLKAAGITSIVLGIAALGTGIPLLGVGAQKVPDRDQAWSPVPAVTVGAGAVSASWRF